MSDRIEAIQKILGEGKTYREAGMILGLSHERVRQIAIKHGFVRTKKNVTTKDLAPKSAKIGFYGKNPPPLQRLKEILNYDRYTGIWVWNEGRRFAGRVAGSLNKDGYIQIRVDNRLFMAHVLAWYYSFEQWPDRQIDHENNTRSDNRLDNLRLATSLQNHGNRRLSKTNTSGFKGVSRYGNRWHAEIAHIKLGVFDTAEEAAAAYEKAAKIRYGEFSRSA